ncbi:MULTISPECIES: hypothetical protein [Streptomyces]|uniref:Uncharacterized protein n=2 Tax=Streptomyces TaxID=1883 RepID=A0ABV9IT87_9ACTN
MSDGQYVVIRSREEVQKQLAEAWERLEEVSEGNMPPTLRELHGIDSKAFSLLIQAMVQLGQSVDKEIEQLAGLRPVDTYLS